MIKKVSIGIVVWVLLMAVAWQSSAQTYLPLVAANSMPKFCAASAYHNLMTQDDFNTLRLDCYHDWRLGGTNLPEMTRIQTVKCDVYYEGYNIYFTPRMAVLSLDADYDGILIFLIEPDLVDACSMTPEEAVRLFRFFRLSYPNAIITSPAVSFVDTRNDFPWLKKYFEVADKLGIDVGPDLYSMAWYYQLDEVAATDNLRAIMAGRGDSDKGIIVAEFGAKTTAVMTRYTEFIMSQDDMIGMVWSPILDPSTHDTADNPGPGKPLLSWEPGIYGVRELTDIGQAFVAAWGGGNYE